MLTDDGESTPLSFRDSLKLKAYQETIDKLNKRISVLESKGVALKEKDAAKLEAYRDVLDMLEYGGGLGNIY